MGKVRPAVEEDAEAIANLYQRVFGTTGEATQGTLESYVEEIFFCNPWRSKDQPCLVYQADDGRIIGFLGVIPRRMSFRGRSIRVAVCSCFMVDLHSRADLAALQLIKAFFSGPQDMSITDGANDISRRVWERFGGSTALLHSMYWTRSLRPTQSIWHQFENKRRVPRLLNVVGRPLLKLVDIIGVRVPPNRLPQLASHIIEEQLDIETLASCITKFSRGFELRAEYESSTLRWLLDRAVQKTQHGMLRKNVVRNGEGEIIGWYLCYVNAGGIGQVLHIGATRHSIYEVLNHLFVVNWRHGSLAISGRLIPMFMQDLSNAYCTFHSGPWTLVHSRHAELLQCIHRGDGFVSRLEGEWWTRFLELTV